MKMIQLSLIQEEFDYEIAYEKLLKDVEKVKEEWDRSRKSQFARIAELQKMYQEIAHELQILKLNICKGRLVL